MLWLEDAAAAVLRRAAISATSRAAFTVAAITRGADAHFAAVACGAKFPVAIGRAGGLEAAVGRTAGRVGSIDRALIALLGPRHDAIAAASFSQDIALQHIALNRLGSLQGAAGA